MRKLVLPLLFTSLGFLACTGSGDDGDDNTQPPGPPAPRNVDAIPGGGTSGGAIQDVLTVFALDSANVPVVGATVLVIHKGEELKLQTDAEGRVDFWKVGLDSSLSLHVFKDGYQFQSFIGGNASVVTLGLDDGTPPSMDTAKIGTITGTISGWDLLPANGMSTSRLATVLAAGEDLANVDQRPRPGTVTPNNPSGSPYNLAINGNNPFPMWSDYELDADIRLDRVYAIGGIFDAVAGDVTSSHIGISQALTVAEGETVSANIELTHALDQTIEVSAPNLPALDEQGAVFALRFGEKGALLSLSFREVMGGSASAQGPALTGALSEVLYTAGVRAASTEQIGDEPAKSVFAIKTQSSLSFTFDSLLSPPDFPTGMGRTIGTNPVNGASVHVLKVTDSSSRGYWEVVVLGDAPTTVELPAVPAGLTDPLTGDRILDVFVIDLGSLDLNNTSFDDLDSSVVSSAGARAEVSF